jgi:hypothetical protein
VARPAVAHDTSQQRVHCGCAADSSLAVIGRLP